MAWRRGWLATRAGTLDEWWASHSVTTSRFGLRPWRSGDRDAVVRAVDDEVVRWQGWRSAELDCFPEHYALQIEQMERRARKRRRMPLGCPSDFVVTDPDGRIVGTMALRGEPRQELGWWLGPTARGQGFSAEMLSLGLAYAHDHLGIGRVTMGCATDNVRVQAQVARCGCELVSDTVPRTLPNGERVVSLLYEHIAPPASSSPWPVCRRA